MTVLLHALAVETFAPMLHTLSLLLERGAEKLDPAAMVAARLAPDMFPLTQQVQFACFQAEEAVLRLSGGAPTPLATPDEDVEQLQRRIAATIERIREVPEAAFVGAEERMIVRPLVDGLVIELSGLRFLREWSFPNFYFHLVTAYGILRHHGVELGKRDYMRHIGPAIRPA